MNEPELEPFSTPIRILLQCERPVPPAPAALKQEVLLALEASLGLPADGATGGAGTELEAPPLGTAASGAASSAAKLAVVATLAFGLGGTTVAVLDRTLLARPPSRAPAAEPVTPEPAVPEEVPSLVTPAEPAPAKKRPPKAAEAEQPKSLLRRDQTLAEERAVLERARTALWRGSFEEALSAVAEHSLRFPAGELAEEREALWVQALRGAGHEAEAGRRAEAFRRAYPESILLPVVEEAGKGGQ